MNARDKYFSRFLVPAAGPHNPHCSLLLVRKSRFIAQTCCCSNRCAAKDFTDIIRGIHPDATHNCWAYVAGRPADTADVGSSDDGEPHGTAGRPMLQILLHSGIGQICTVVSRWFGGIKLGTGGLARAYQDAVLENLKTLQVKERVNLSHCRITLDYAQLESVRRILPEFEVVVLGEEFNAKVSLELTVPEDKWKEFCARLAIICNGKENISLITELPPKY